MAGYLYNTSWLLTKFILLILHSAASIPWHSVNVAPSALLQPDRVTALSEGSDHVFHLRVQGGDWLCNTGTLSHWRSLTEPYLQSQGVNHLDGLILHDPPAHEAEVLKQVISEFPDTQIVSPTQWRLDGERQFVQMEQGNSASNRGPKSAPIEIISADAGRGTLQTVAILVHLDQFRILILPSVSEATIADLKCDHVDVVYCGRLRGRRFPRSLLIAKLSPSILVLSGTKPEIMANPRDGIESPKSLYLKQDGAVTAALLNHELVVRSYRGSELRLRSLSR
jgi:hypothetical protein